MEETNSQTQKQQIQRQLSPTHSGSGGLRGGGIRPRLSIRNETLANFCNKLENRIGPILLFCLITIATVLIINTIYHESANGTLIELIEGIQKEIIELQQKEVAQFVGIESTTTTLTTLITEIGNDTLATRGNELISEEISQTTKSTADNLRPIILKRTEQISELNLYKERFHEIDQKIILIILICLLGILLSIAGMICRRRGGIQPSKSSRIIYGIILVAICFLLIIQLFIFIISLLPNAFSFNSSVDKLLDFYLISEVPKEKRQTLIDPIENSFGCKLKVEHQLLEQLGIQEPCAPKIKDRLLAPYIILFLILIVLSPFLHSLFIIIWSKKLKDVKPILNARHKVAASNEARIKRFKEKIENV
ncbi:hypothetical protein ACQ4LE_002692 [Meloidogyne hapla]|uniref:Uncharacterized protein n=1 Tax=Meloidogyne hapla TaxID=6305 RepID=A0A1I8AYS0_MELHA